MSSATTSKKKKTKLSLEEFCKINGIETPLEQSKQQAEAAEEEVVYVVDNSSSSKKKNKALKQGDKNRHTSRNTSVISYIQDDFEGDVLYDYYDIGDDSDEDDDVVIVPSSTDLVHRDLLTENQNLIMSSGNSTALENAGFSRDNVAGSSASSSSLTSNNVNSKHSGRINLSTSIRTDISKVEKKELNSRIKLADKLEARATVEQVIDTRTRMILFKLMNNGFFYSVNGCVSTGKEANVYIAYGDKEEENSEKQYAVKIYKTSILVFKDRDRYVTGEYRFKSGYSKHNPRKMVRVWAEKEMRNLRRLENVGIPCPSVHVLKQHVLVMSFIGKNGWPAPRLKDAKLTESKYREIYLDIIKSMRTMYQKAKLVHGDLSEYNMLYFKGRVYIIDVSQSVENDHPNALEFLRKDCENIKNFFYKNGLTNIMTTRELFDFVTDITLRDEQIDSYLETMMEKIQDRAPITAKEEVDAEVFKQVYIPRTLGEIMDYEAHRDKVEMQENTDDIFYRSVTGINMNLDGAATTPYGLTEQEAQQLEGQEEANTSTPSQTEASSATTVEPPVIVASSEETPQPEEQQTTSSSIPEQPTNETAPGGEDNDEEELIIDDSSSEEEDGKKGKKKKPPLPDLSAMTKEERKKWVKEYNRERRKTKIPKKVKKKLEKKHKSK
ncbi:predicted protein [Naegleria gruberi]|uniref:Serine/threonine-protein kinase RIO1 n=1 Tax=Naegleria gruberi TaxID=5762 RepID=D2VWG3_NAEGR|nr:uncharacterized protein NAEGRDRAFT_81480 [Naegleria gruberi]EFC38832.1 predicted protein [Naegleria gruberi]|eukprot:XP_002671576.1 predicted protein [Naegleria gruberi strain NEG-M]